MATEDYVSFETAKLLKNKGFDEICRAFYKDWNDEINLCDCNRCHCFDYCNNSILENYSDKDELNIAAPTLQMTMKWLREVHNLFIMIDICFDDDRERKPGYIFHIWQTKPPYELLYYHIEKVYDSPEETCSAAIKYCLEKLI